MAEVTMSVGNWLFSVTGSLLSSLQIEFHKKGRQKNVRDELSDLSGPRPGAHHVSIINHRLISRPPTASTKNFNRVQAQLTVLACIQWYLTLLAERTSNGDESLVVTLAKL